MFLSRALRSEDGTLPLSVFHTDGSGKLSGRLYVTLQVIFQRAALSRAGSVEADRTDISARSWERNLEGRTGCAPQTPPTTPTHIPHSLSPVAHREIVSPCRELAVTPADSFSVDPPQRQTQLPADMSRHSCQKITRFRRGWMNLLRVPREGWWLKESH